MPRAMFALAAGVNSAWITNAARLLGRPIPRTAASARACALLRMLQADFGLSLHEADRAAQRALREPPDALLEVRRSCDGSATLLLDMSRFHAICNARLASAKVHCAPAVRGRRRASGPDAVAAAAAFGVDIGLLRANLSRTPAQRLAALDENAGFVRELRSTR